MIEPSLDEEDQDRSQPRRVRRAGRDPGEFDAEAPEHGLASRWDQLTTASRASRWRRFGLDQPEVRMTVDNLISVDIVTAGRQAGSARALRRI